MRRINPVKSASPVSSSASKPASLLKLAATLFVYCLLVSFASLMFAPVLMSDIPALRVTLNVAMVAACITLFFSLGAGRGMTDSSSDDLRGKRGDAHAGFYNKTRVLLAALLAAAPWIVTGIFTSLTVKPYTYQPQDLPGWLKAYRFMQEVDAPLRHYDRVATTNVSDWLHIAQRFALLPFVNLFALSSDAAAFQFDTLSFLPPLLLPLSYYAGYLTGPPRYAKEKAMIEAAKKKPKMRLKKETVKRRQRAGNDEQNRLI